MRHATLGVIALVMLVACTDLREYRGEWTGARVGEAAALRTGITESATATLSIESVDQHGLRGTLDVSSLIDHVELVSVEGAEADKLAGMTFTGGPIRVYLAFAPITDALGDALVMVALYDDRRIEVRIMRGGTTPLYGIFELTTS
ncbi:MAG: hypothetical protein H0T79_16310 [Deltaproteobacteria bacterium]|nr:hypothetical protein [Deltaproteobacteria bacterium]